MRRQEVTTICLRSTTIRTLFLRFAFILNTPFLYTVWATMDGQCKVCIVTVQPFIRVRTVWLPTTKRSTIKIYDHKIIFDKAEWTGTPCHEAFPNPVSLPIQVNPLSVEAQLNGRDIPGIGKDIKKCVSLLITIIHNFMAKKINLLITSNDVSFQKNINLIK